MMAPFMGHDDDGREVSDAPAVLLQPRRGVVDRFLGRTVDGQLLRTGGSACCHHRCRERQLCSAPERHRR